MNTATRRMSLITVGRLLLALGLAVWHAEVAAFVERFSPGCALYKWTGLKCPGCGGSRAAIALLHGHWGQVLRLNAFWLPTLAVVLIIFAEAWRRALGLWPICPRWDVWRGRLYRAYALICVLFIITRNIWNF